jgi:flagellin
MSLTVNTNISALIAQLNLGRSTKSLNTSLERLATGLKINRAVDDAAGLVISEYQRAQISGLDKAITNIDRAVSFVQTAEGSLGEINAILTDLRALAVDSANSGSLDSVALEANQAAAKNLLDNIDRIANNAKFGTKTILDGNQGINGFTTNQAATFLAATDSTVTGGQLAINVTTAATQASTTAGTAQTATLASEENLILVAGGGTVAIALEAGLTQTQVIARINEYSGQTGVTAKSTGGATMLTATLWGVGGKFTIQSDQAAAASTSGFGTTVSSGTGVDIVGSIGGGAATGKGQVLTGNAGASGAGVSLQITGTTTGALGSVILADLSPQFQIGAFSGETSKLTLAKTGSASLALQVGTTVFPNLRAIDMRTKQGASDAIAMIDKAIQQVASQRGTLGAFQAQNLEVTQSVLRNQITNLRSAESVLRDTDYTTEITNFTREQVRQQAATTVLGLANQNAQAVLALLAGQ